jgi:transposase
MASVDSMVPADHPVRRLRPLVQRVLADLNADLDALYGPMGRPSIPPERLLKSMLLMALFSVRSERQLCEQLGYNMLFRWFLDLDLGEPVFDASTFSKNRQRLLDGDVGRKFFEAVLGLSEARSLMSSDHFSVDGTLIDAAASTKSFRPKGEKEGDSNGFADFKGTKRTNETHESRTDAEARLYRKGRGREAKLSFMAHVLMENRSGLVADFELTSATGTAEREAAIRMLNRERERRRKRNGRKRQSKSAKGPKERGRTLTVAADKAYDTRDFVRACREAGWTPHVAQNQNARRRSAIDGRTTAQPGYAASTKARMLIEKIFGWSKTIGGFRRTRLKGTDRTCVAGFMVMSAYNLTRIERMTRIAA